MQTNRLYFIDAVRAFAILMMLQGHFIETLLNPNYIDSNNIFFQIWTYFRGVTAPMFFTISGLVFTYLLLRAYQKGKDKKRIKKGLFRGLLLIVIGYSLRVNIISWLTGHFNTYVLVVDVLQCIGLSLIILVGLHVILKKHTYVFSITLFTIGLLCFITEPLIRNLTVGSNVPLIFANYITKSNGSIFTILPWFGYSAFGAFISTVFFRHVHRNRFKTITIITFFCIGIFLIHGSTALLFKLYDITGFQLLERSANFNYLFERLGDVLLIFGIFYSLEQFLKQSIITKIGEKTLSMYVIHSILLYGSYIGYGLKRFYYKALTPNEAIIGALTFILIVCFIAFHYAKPNAFVYKLIRKVIHKLKGNSHVTK